MKTTWDGLPVSSEPPFGAAVILFRRASERRLEFLVLHRSQVVSREGDWAWGPPAGARFPKEPIEVCARRELFEETGVVTEVVALPTDEGTWALFVAEVGPTQDVVLSAEHDDFGWVELHDAVRRCLPKYVGVGFAIAAREIARRESPARTT